MAKERENPKTAMMKKRNEEGERERERGICYSNTRRFLPRCVCISFQLELIEVAKKEEKKKLFYFGSLSKRLKCFSFSLYKSV